MFSKRILILTCTIVALASADGVAQIPASKRHSTADNAALKYWQAYASMSRALNAQTKQKVDSYFLTEIDDAAREAVRQCRGALRLLRSGGRSTHCSWGVDLSEGIVSPVEHYQPVRALTRLACLSARVHFESGRPREGIEDVFAILSLGRHVGNDDLTVCRLTQCAVEVVGVVTLARYLPKIGKAELRGLQKRLDALPAIKGLAPLVALEKRLFLNWVRREARRIKTDRDVESFYKRLGGSVLYGNRQLGLSEKQVNAIRKAGGSTRKQLLKLIAGAGAPFDVVSGMEYFKKKQLSPTDILSPTIKPKNALAAAVLEQYNGFHFGIGGVMMRHLMLKAAVAIELDGPDAVKRFQDPYSGKPIQLRKHPKGYELASSLHKHVRIFVGMTPVD